MAALQQSSLYLGKLMIQSAVNGISLASTAPISAFTAATRVENFTQAFGISGCESIAIFVAQNQGARKHRRALSGFVRGGALVISTGLIFSALLHLFAPAFSAVFLESGSGALALCSSYLRLMAGSTGCPSPGTPLWAGTGAPGG